jgi:hypothetical protein
MFKPPHMNFPVEFCADAADYPFWEPATPPGIAGDQGILENNTMRNAITEVL